MSLRFLWLAVAVVFVLGAGLALVRAGQAVGSGLAAKRALLAAEADLGATRAAAAKGHLLEAQRGFARSRSQLRSAGPALTLARFVPFVRVQVRGVEAFADAGRLLAEAGLPIAEAAGRVADPQDANLPVDSALDTLKATHASLRAGLTSLTAANARVRSLDGYRLVGPLDGARRDLLTRLPRINQRAGSAERGMEALITFAGGGGARRYLVFSQNPDELRPTGGFIGTYGVLETESGKLALERYDAIEAWLKAHPGAVVPPEEAGPPFPFLDPPKPQSIANVNNVPDWGAATRLAMRLWQAGGEQPVDGALSITPAFLARVLSVLGPVTVPGYDETVTSANALERIDFHTHEAPPSDPGTPGSRKDFVAALAQVVVKGVLSAPATKWQGLAREVGAAFDRREAMVWSNDGNVALETKLRRWNGTLPETFGDFFYNGEFESAAKNGRGLKRTFDHHVELKADGGARVTTVMTIANTRPPARFNQHAYSYITLYGPAGARINPLSDPHEVPEASLAGHPASAWFRSAEPLGQAIVKVVWDAPAVARRIDGGAMEYGLWWMALPDHTGDVLNLRVDPPPEWRWDGDAPPTSVTLNGDFVDTWVLVRGG